MTTRFAAFRLAMALFPLAFLVTILQSGCSGAPDPWGASAPSPRVVATFPPIASWTKKLLGDSGSVHSLCTATGPHHHEFQVKEGQLLRRADLFVMNGLTLDDHFANKLIKGHAPKSMKVLNLGNLLPEDLVLEMPHNHDEAEEAHAGHDHHNHDHGNKDPHYWLGVPQATFSIRQLAGELGKSNPDLKAKVDANAEELIKTLQDLKSGMVERLKNKTDRKVITMHESMGYFARSFGFKVVDVIQVDPGAEPSAPRLVKLLERCKKTGVRTIIVEPQYPKTSGAAWLSAELKKAGLEPRLIEIDPMETFDGDGGPDGDWYVQTLKANLERLAEGLP
jgi:zinc transport system substrate-binding protein